MPAFHPQTTPKNQQNKPRTNKKNNKEHPPEKPVKNTPNRAGNLGRMGAIATTERQDLHWPCAAPATPSGSAILGGTGAIATPGLEDPRWPLRRAGHTERVRNLGTYGRYRDHGTPRSTPVGRPRRTSHTHRAGRRSWNVRALSRPLNAKVHVNPGAEPATLSGSAILECVDAIATPGRQYSRRPPPPSRPHRAGPQSWNVRALSRPRTPRSTPVGRLRRTGHTERVGDLGRYVRYRDHRTPRSTPALYWAGQAAVPAPDGLARVGGVAVEPDDGGHDHSEGDGEHARGQQGLATADGPDHRAADEGP